MRAVVTVPLADVLHHPVKGSSLEHQLLLGENIEIHEENGVYYSIMTSNEQYLGWIQKEQCRLYASYESLYAEKNFVVVAEKMTSCYLPQQRKFLSLLAGTKVEVGDMGGGYLTIRLPSGKEGWVNPETVIYHRNSSLQNILSTARDISAWEIPYLWGGVSPQGVDCSGLMKLVLRLNGITAFPRDAWQQYARIVGNTYHPEGVAACPLSLADLQAGDFVFFTSPDQRKVTHVGMMVTDTSFTHASRKMHEKTNGTNCVAISQFESDSFFGDHYAQYFVGGRRFFA